MADAPKILGTDSLRQAYPKLNKSIDNSNEALNKSTTAETNSTAAVNTANAAETKADSVQEQFNQVVIDGDSSVEAAQARVEEDGTANATLKERLDKKEKEFASQLADIAINVKMFGAKGDGSTNDQSAIVAAVNEAYNKGQPLNWPKGTYVSDANIPNFHNVRHTGEGVINRGTDFYAITPKATDTNILYTGYGSLSTNDGLSSSQPRKLSNVRDVLQNLGNKTENGQWRIQFVAGTITDTGLVFNNLPYFSKPLQIWGVWDGTNRLAVWDGINSAAVFAFRADGTNNTLNVEFKDLKFINWKADPSNAGAIVAYFGVNVRTDNVEVKDSTVGIWCRGGWSRHYGDVLDTCVWGYGFQYSHSATIGSSIYPRNTIKNCTKGIMLGRTSVIHADYTDFENNTVDINVHQKSRVACVGSTFKGWKDVSIWLQGDSLLEDDGSTWDAASITDATPIYRFDTGSSVPAVHIGPLPYRVAHYCPSTGYTLTGVTDDTIISEQPGFGSPLRIPKNMLYNNGTLQIQIEARIDMAGSGGTKRVRLSGPGSSASYELGFIDIPAGGGLGTISFEVTFKPNGTALLKIKYESSNASLNVVKFNTVSGTMMNTIRDKTTSVAGWRLYASLANAADSLSLSSLTTTIMG